MYTVWDLIRVADGWLSEFRCADVGPSASPMGNREMYWRMALRRRWDPRLKITKVNKRLKLKRLSSTVSCIANWGGTYMWTWVEPTAISVFSERLVQRFVGFWWHFAWHFLKIFIVGALELLWVLRLTLWVPKHLQRDIKPHPWKY